MEKRINGRALAKKIQGQLKEGFLGKEVHFSIVSVGRDELIERFISYKKKFGEELGVAIQVYRFSEDISQEELTEALSEIEPISDALIIQLPLPNHLNTREILDLIPPEKDIDVLSSTSLRFLERGKSFFLPPVTGAILEVLSSLPDDNIFEKHIVLLGKGKLVGGPLSLWFSSQGMYHDLIDRDTEILKRDFLLKKADIIITGIGKPHFLLPTMIRDGVILIDAGTSEIEKKINGDIHPACYDRASYYTPVPGGIGPLTIAILYRNLLKAIQMKNTDTRDD